MKRLFVVSYARCGLVMLVGLCVLQLGAGEAVSQDLIWKNIVGGPQYQNGYGVAVDGAGNIFVTGSFTGTADFGGGPLVSQGGDAFLVKYDAGGTHVWSKRFGAATSEAGEKVSVDGFGNVYVTGQYSLPMDMGGGPLPGGDFYLAKFAPDGTHLWSMGFTTVSVAHCNDVFADASGNVYITGSFPLTIDLGGGPMTSDGQVDVFVAKYDPNGAHLWSKQFGEDLPDPPLSAVSRGEGVSVDGLGNVYVTGRFSERINFGGTDLNSAGWKDIFLAKFDTAGNHIWSARFGAAGKDEGAAVAADVLGNVYVTGSHDAGTDFGGGALPAGMFLARFDAAGTHVWSTQLGTSEAYGVDVDVDGTDGFVATGSLDSQSLDGFWWGTMGTFRYDANGNQLWAAISGANTTGFPLPRAVASDGSGNACVTGGFTGTTDLGDGSVTSTATTESDMFLAKYGEVASSVGSGRFSGTVLHPNIPNPFNPTTTIRFDLEHPARVRLSVFDVKGRLVKTLVDRNEEAGAHVVQWNGTNDRGDAMSSGVYFYRLAAGTTSLTRKMVLLK